MQQYKWRLGVSGTGKGHETCCFFLMYLYWWAKNTMSSDNGALAWVKKS
jgi:hypothetical protein